MNLKNIGRVKVTLSLIYDNPNAFKDYFMSRVIVLRAEILPNDVIEYIIYNKNLKKISEGEKIPEYLGVIGDDGSLSFKEIW